MNHIRHSGIFSASGLNVTLVGAGGIGAITALTLAKIGIKYLTIYDDDVVSEENMATQYHKLADLGVKKVEALQDTIRLFADDTQVFVEPSRIGSTDVLSGSMVISAVDSISARKDIWAAVQNGKSGWYIDSRMAAEEAHLFVIDMQNDQDVAWYDQMITNEDDSRVFEAPCTSKSTIYAACLCAALIGRTVRLILTGQKPPKYYVQNLISDFLFRSE